MTHVHTHTHTHSIQYTYGILCRKLQTVLRQPPNTDPPTNSSTDENTITGNKVSRFCCLTIISLSA